MKVRRTENGIVIDLSGVEIAEAIETWLAANGAIVSGPRMITVNTSVLKFGRIHVDRAGAVEYGGKRFESIREVE